MSLEYQNRKRLQSKLVWRHFCEKKKLISTYVAGDLEGEEIVGTFYEKELRKTNQKELRTGKVIKKNVINYMLNGKALIVSFTGGLIKET